MRIDTIPTMYRSGVISMHVKMIALIGNGDIRYSDIKEKLDAVRKLYPDAMWISSGAACTGLIVAKYAILNKIPLFMCIPFPPEVMNANWVKGWQNSLNEALKYALRVSIGSDVFSFEGYQKCKERMIDHADIVVVFNRNLSSDADCVFYAKSAGKLVLDGFSLSTPIPKPHAGFWTYPVAYRPPGSANPYREAVYGNVIPVNQSIIQI